MVVMDLSQLQKQGLNEDLLERLKTQEGDRPRKNFERKVNENVWSLSKNAEGNASAIIRFLPGLVENDQRGRKGKRFWVELQKHTINEGGRWLIANCPKTLGNDEKCPICEMSSALYNSGNTVRGGQFRKKKNYWSNVYVIADREAPENNGRVVLFRFGKKIFDKIMAKLATEDEFGESRHAIDVFDLSKGCNMRLKMKQVSGYNNFDDSEFDMPAEFVPKDGKTVEDVLSLQQPLSTIDAAEEFESYDVLSERLSKFLDMTQGDSGSSERTPKSPKNPTPKPVINDDDDDAIFRKLADDIPF